MVLSDMGKVERTPPPDENEELSRASVVDAENPKSPSPSPDNEELLGNSIVYSTGPESPTPPPEEIEDESRTSIVYTTDPKSPSPPPNDNEELSRTSAAEASDVQSPSPTPPLDEELSRTSLMDCMNPKSPSNDNEEFSRTSVVENTDPRSPSPPPNGHEDLSRSSVVESMDATDVSRNENEELSSSLILDTTGPKSPDENEELSGTSLIDTLDAKSQSPPPDIDEEMSQSSPPDNRDGNSQTTSAISQDSICPPSPNTKAEPNDEDMEDLEDGEIASEEEEEKEEPPKPPSKPVEKSSKSKSSPREKEKERSEPSKKKKEKEDLDPVKKLLAEVREKDRTEKERRRKEKKRSKTDEKEKEPPVSKKKRRKLSEEEEEGEEFLFVRGGSPHGDEGWPEEDIRHKRRRESDGSGSPMRHRRGHDESGEQNRRERMPMERERSKRSERRDKSDTICAYFMQGKCQKSAEACNFSHDAVPPRKMELCKFWMMECCAKKEKCLYLHNDFPCKFFHTGLVCKQGDRCKFSHQPLSDVTKQVLLKHIETAPKEILGDFPRLNRNGALNLINKMEAKLKGLQYSEEDHDEEPSPQDRHHHSTPERHGSERHSHHHDRHHDRDSRGHYHSHYESSRGRGGHSRHGHREERNHDRGSGDKRQSRWEQTQPTRNDQEKLKELMNEAGISGFYKDTIETNPNTVPVAVTQAPSDPSTTQPAMFPANLTSLPNPLLPLLPQFLPQMLPQSQAGLAQISNPAFASVLASLNLPTSAMVPGTTTAMPVTAFPSTMNVDPANDEGKPSNVTPEATPEHSDEKESSEEPSDPVKSLPDNLPKKQRELFLRIQQQQIKNENKLAKPTEEPEEPAEENWYSDDEEDDSKKKEALKAEINDQISSVLNQIRQQSQQQASGSQEQEGLKTFFGDTDLRSKTSAAGYKDVDLRTNIFKKVDIPPATEINASLSSHGPMPYKVNVVLGYRDKPDYSHIRSTLTPEQLLRDPRFEVTLHRNNSISAPESPTDQSAETLSQPMSIPNATPVFDPRTKTSSQTNRTHVDNSANPFVPENKDPRGASQNAATASQVAAAAAGSAAQAQNLALAQNFAAAAALMQQQWPNGQPPIDPNLFMLAGFPFLPQVPVTTTSQPQNSAPVDFGLINNSAAAATAGMRLRAPFVPPAVSQATPSSSWERFSKNQGNLSPPL